MSPKKCPLGGTLWVPADILVISGNRAPHIMQDDVALLRHEISEGDFSKSFRLPGRIEESMINAQMENGMLTVKIPKSEEAKPKQIEIKF